MVSVGADGVAGSRLKTITRESSGGHGCAGALGLQQDAWALSRMLPGAGGWANRVAKYKDLGVHWQGPCSRFAGILMMRFPFCSKA